MTYVEAMRTRWLAIIDGIRRHEDRAILHDTLGIMKLPIVIPPCPATIGNDPCDDWAPDWLDDEDEDWF